MGKQEQFDAAEKEAAKAMDKLHRDLTARLGIGPVLSASLPEFVSMHLAGACCLEGANPVEYIRDVLSALARMMGESLPGALAKAKELDDTFGKPDAAKGTVQ